jgi:hypothetical protein
MSGQMVTSVTALVVAVLSAGAAVYNTRAGVRLQRDEGARRDAAETASQRLAAYTAFLSASTRLYGACWELGQALRPSTREPEHCTARYTIYEDCWNRYVETKVPALFSAAGAGDRAIEKAISDVLGGTTSLSSVVSARYHQLKRADWPTERSGLDGLDEATRECHKMLEALDRELVHAARTGTPSPRRALNQPNDPPASGTPGRSG